MVPLQIFLLVTLLSALCHSQDYCKWTKIRVEDFPKDPNISMTLTFNDVLCTVEANRNNLCNLFCYDSDSTNCVLYRMPVIKPPYVCDNDPDCDQSSTTCYQKASVGDEFLGLDIKPFSGKDLDKGNVKARNIRNIPMERRWNWPLPPEKVLRLNFTFFDLGPCCTCAYLEVRHSQTGELLAGPFCGVLAVPFSVIIPSNDVELYLYTDGSQVQEGFELDYESFESFTCDPEATVVSEAKGEIAARKVHNTDMTCTWRMNLAAGTMLKMTFTEFDLGACCGCAHLTIVDNEFDLYPLTGSSICGVDIPDPIPATISNDIEITLYTDGSAELPGFAIQYEAVALPTKTGCGNGIVLTEPNGMIRAAVPPNNYALSTTCEWSIEVDSGSRIGLSFLFFSTEEEFDTVTVTDLVSGTALGGGPISGEGIAVPILESSGNKVAIEFVSDHSYNDYGFCIYYYTI